MSPKLVLLSHHLVSSHISWPYHPHIIWLHPMSPGCTFVSPDPPTHSWLLKSLAHSQATCPPLTSLLLFCTFTSMSYFSSSATSIFACSCLQSSWVVKQRMGGHPDT